ncbi:MAG: hypothetical protein E7472_02635 [Ruminococcaceae bacterium]|nr:hypothetical protein [Oscillospiraceae bacterium]
MAYPGPKIKAAQCMLTLYPDSQQEVIEYIINNFSCAYALHDMDIWTQEEIDEKTALNPETPFPYTAGELKKPHYHFILTFSGSGRYFHAIANELGVPMNTICRCNSLRRAYEYLWHKNNPEKYQYSPDIVQTHDFEIPSESSIGREEEEQVRILLEMPAFETTYECARWAWENKVWAAFRRGYAIWRDIRNETHERNYH